MKQGVITMIFSNNAKIKNKFMHHLNKKIIFCIFFTFFIVISLYCFAQSEYKSFFSRAKKYHDGMLNAYETGEWDFACTMAIRCAIFANDALLVAKAGLRSFDPNHSRSVALLKSHIKDSNISTNSHHLSSIIERKSVIEYHGDMPTKKDADLMTKHASRFFKWSEKKLLLES